jgi:predicted secreted protein
MGTPVAGKSGKVTVGAATALNVTNWNADIEIDMIETTSLGDSWKTNIAGLCGWSGSIECSFDSADTTGQIALQNAALAGTDVVLALFTDATHNYAGNAKISNISVEDPVDDKVSISFDFTGNGACAYT